MRQVQSVLKYVGYDFDKKLLNSLFGNEPRYKYKSAKSFRNSLSHSLKQKYIKKLIERYDKLNEDMDTFLNEIINFDKENI